MSDALQLFVLYKKVQTEKQSILANEEEKKGAVCADVSRYPSTLSKEKHSRCAIYMLDNVLLNVLKSIIKANTLLLLRRTDRWMLNACCMITI